MQIGFVFRSLQDTSSVMTLTSANIIEIIFSANEMRNNLKKQMTKEQPFVLLLFLFCFHKISMFMQHMQLTEF